MLDGKEKQVRRFFAAVLLVGGATGVGLTIFLAYRFAQQHWALALLAFALCALFAWSCFVGFRLWQGAPYGRKWAPVLFASQIPVLAVPGLHYQWFTGANFGPVLTFSGGSVNGTLAFNVGANGEFYVGAGGSGFMLGANLFAVLALVCLVRSNNSFKPMPLRGTA